MGVSIIVGGQYGSEGKGKVAAFVAKCKNTVATVRVGGPNSGHTVYDNDGNKHVLRMIPSAAAVRDDIDVIMPAGSYINVNVLLSEKAELNISDSKLHIDPNAVIVGDFERETERGLLLDSRIGSTLSGTGIALLRRVSRPDNLLFAKDIPELQPYISDTKAFMRELLDLEYNIVIEGTQGYGLSNYHSPEYPYVTSRDTTAAGFLAEAGLSPLDVEDIIMVIRTYPIRVGGNSGPLKDEITWEEVATRGGFSKPFWEHTSVTHNLRRVALFDPEIVKRAIAVNRPTMIVLNHVDYIDAEMTDGLTKKQISFIVDIERKIKHRIDCCGYSPSDIANLDHILR